LLGGRGRDLAGDAPRRRVSSLSSSRSAWVGGNIWCERDRLLQPRPFRRVAGDLLGRLRPGEELDRAEKKDYEDSAESNGRERLRNRCITPRSLAGHSMLRPHKSLHVAETLRCYYARREWRRRMDAEGGATRGACT